MKTKSFEFEQYFEEDEISFISNTETQAAIENCEIKSIISKLFLLKDKNKNNVFNDQKNLNPTPDIKNVLHFNPILNLNYNLFQKVFKKVNLYAEKDKNNVDIKLTQSPSLVYTNISSQIFEKDYSLIFSTSLLKYESNLSLQKNPFSLNIDCKSLQQVYIMKERAVLKKGEAFEFICRHQLLSFMLKCNFKNSTIFDGIPKISTINRFLEQVSNVVNSNWKSEQVLRSEACKKFIEAISDNQDMNFELYNNYRNEISKLHINNLIMEIIFKNLKADSKTKLNHYRGKRLSKNVLRVVRNELAKKVNY